MAFKEELAEAIVQVQESEDGSGTITNTTSALTGAITNRLDQGLAVLKRQAQEKYKGKFVGGDGINEAIIRPGAFVAVIKGDEDYCLYVSGMQITLYAGTKRPVGKQAYLGLCFDEEVEEPLFKEAQKQLKAGVNNPKPIETILKKYILDGNKLISVSAHGIG